MFAEGFKHSVHFSHFFYKLEDNCFTIFVGFCHTSIWISHMEVPSLLNLPQVHTCPLPLEPPPRLLNCHTAQGWAPRSPLAIYFTYGNIHFHSILSEKVMAPHSSTLAWKIPWMEEPGRLQSMGSQRIGNYWATSLSLFTFMHWRRKWQPTPVFLPGESQGRGSLGGCRLWDRTESDTTDAT